LTSFACINEALIRFFQGADHVRTLFVLWGYPLLGAVAFQSVVRKT